MLSGPSKAPETAAEPEHSQRRKKGLEERKKGGEQRTQDWDKRDGGQEEEAQVGKRRRCLHSPRHPGQE